MLLLDIFQGRLDHESVILRIPSMGVASHWKVFRQHAKPPTFLEKWRSLLGQQKKSSEKAVLLLSQKIKGCLRIALATCFFKRFKRIIEVCF